MTLVGIGTRTGSAVPQLEVDWLELGPPKEGNSPVHKEDPLRHLVLALFSGFPLVTSYVWSNSCKLKRYVRPCHSAPCRAIQ